MRRIATFTVLVLIVLVLAGLAVSAVMKLQSAKAETLAVWLPKH
jgi:hypothetical protein